MRSIFAIIVFVISINHLSAQKMVIPSAGNSTKVVNYGTELKDTPCAGAMNPHYITEDWNVTLTNLSAFHHVASLPKSEFKILKDEANQRRIDAEKNIINSAQQSGRTMILSPKIGKNFRGNLRGNNVPMDNSMAISRNGFIVSAINSNVIFTNPDGKVTFTKGFPEFFTLLSLGTRMYDPRVIYDTDANRFIFLCLHGSEPSNTFLCLAFSKTEDPNGEWFYYKIDGNPSGDDRWFDYPNIAISKHDFYIAGLMRDTPGDWQYSVLYQIDKHDGYEGKSLTWKYYNDLKDADGKPSFNLVPTPSGWNELLDPGMYFVSNNANGGDTYNLYFTNQSIENQPTLTSLQTKGTLTQLAPDGRQPNTANVLNTFDSRIWSALYLDSTIHIGSHVNTPAGDVGLFYGRMNVNNLELNTNILTESKRDFGFPSFSAFGNNKSDQEILVNYLVSGPELFPSQEQRVCGGTRDNFDWSEPTLLKKGASYVNVLSDNNERWGDYTTSCRRFVNDRIETWVTGCFGENGSYGTWLGQFLNQNVADTEPMAEFVSDLTTTKRDTTIVFTDITSHDPTSWLWSFPGGNPSFATTKDPKVTYTQNGSYDVTLVVTNALGTDTLTKQEYIHIQDPVIKPIADFEVVEDTIYAGDLAYFKNHSSSNTINHKWTFASGSPSSSTEFEPVIRYNNPGSFLVALSVSNIAGANSKIKQKAITAIKRVQPTVKIMADKTQITIGDSIHFYDQSTGGPTEWQWSFDGGTPSSSNQKNPVVKYSSEGIYDIALKVSNSAGQDSVAFSGFVHVGVNSVDDTSPLKNINLYPNPVINDEARVHFYNEVSTHYTIYLINSNGMIIKELVNSKIKKGDNLLTFNTYNLTDGQYFLRFSDGSKYVETVGFTLMR